MTQTLCNSIEIIEAQTDFDVLNHSEFTIDVIDRFGSDGEVETLNIYGKGTEEIINLINQI